MNKRKTARTKADRMAGLERSNQSQDESVDQTYEVETILKKKIEDGIEYYLVSWKGYPLSEATWEPKSHLTECSSLIVEYELAHLPQQTKEDLAGKESEESFRPQTDPLTPAPYEHNLNAIRPNSTLLRCQDQISFLQKKAEEYSKLPPNAETIEILDCGRGKQALTWFDVRLQDNEVRRVSKQEVTKDNKLKLVQFYEKLIRWST